MKTNEIIEREKLHKKWASGKITRTEMNRCMELDRQLACENKSKTGGRDNEIDSKTNRVVDNRGG